MTKQMASWLARHFEHLGCLMVLLFWMGIVAAYWLGFLKGGR